MALEKTKDTKEITLRQTFSDNGVTVMLLTGVIGQDGYSNPPIINVMNYDLYNSNRTAVRQAQTDFQQKLWDTEDEMRETSE